MASSLAMPGHARATTVIRLLRGLVTVAGIIGVLSFGAAALVTVADVFGRMVGVPVLGVVDLVQLFVVAGAWLVIPYAFIAGSHVGVDLIVDNLPKRWQRLLRAMGSLVSVVLLAVALFACFKSFQLEVMFGDRSQQLGIPISWYWIPLLTGMALSIVAAALTIVDPPASQEDV